MILPNFTILIPEMTVLAGIVLVLFADLFVKQKEARVTFWLSELVIVAAAIVTALQFGHPTEISFAGTFIRDDFATVSKLFIYLAVFITFFFSVDYINARKIPRGEYYLLGLFSLLGMMVLVSAHSLVTIFMGVELLSLPLYAMIAMHRESDLAVEAGMKYFILGAVATATLLYGMSMIYGACGSLSVTAIAAATHQLSGIHLAMFGFGLLFLIGGLAFKLGAVPFHSWVPDVYQGAPISVTLFISTGPKVAALAMTIRLLVEMLPGLQTDWQLWLTVIAIASMGVGNMMALVQTSIRRLLAYSSVAQMGYMLLGVIAGNAQGYSAATFYAITYMLTSLAAFSLLTMLSRKNELDDLNSLKGLNSRNPWMAFMMLLIMFSMAGVPPLVGFFAKVAVFVALVHAHLVWIACVAVVLAVIGAFYYIRVVRVMYFEEPEESTRITVAGNTWILFTLNSLVLLALGILPAALMSLCSGLF